MEHNMESLITKYIIGAILAVISHFGGKLVSKVFPINSKFFAGITAAIFLFLSLLFFSILLSVSVPVLFAERSLYFLFVMILVGGYYGFLSNFGKESEQSELLNTTKDN